MVCGKHIEQTKVHPGTIRDTLFDLFLASTEREAVQTTWTSVPFYDLNRLKNNR